MKLRPTYLLAVKGYDISTTRLTCYSGAGFDEDLRAEARRDNLIQLVGLDMLYPQLPVQ